MAMWRPPSSNTERTIRAIRSMQNGSLDGRIVSAFPVRDWTDDPDNDLMDADEVDASDTGEDVNLQPYTDYFNLTTNGTLVFNLTFTPWFQSLMEAGTEDRATLHIYWNGVFQRDLSYSLYGSKLIIKDPDLEVRTGDVLSVKYWYNVDNPTSDPDGPGGGSRYSYHTFQMECWMSSIELRPPYGPLYGPIGGPPIGTNKGSLSMISTRYVELEFIADWWSTFRLPKGLTIPTGPSVRSIEWMVSYDPGADIYIKSADFYRKGDNPGDAIGRKDLCGLGQPCVGECNPPVLSSYPSTSAPTPGREGGVVMLSGAQAKTYASLANTTLLSGEHYGFSVNRQSPHSNQTSYGRCTLSFNDGAFVINVDDTLYGTYHIDLATYDIEIGVTCYVVVDEEAE